MRKRYAVDQESLFHTVSIIIIISTQFWKHILTTSNGNSVAIVTEAAPAGSDAVGQDADHHMPGKLSTLHPVHS
ncbi:hypothetical protein DBV23_13005 [Edwardsiella ictaluri]|nr:hypothetical protein DBV23_13005 [Edwardsiella ictaluri]KMQ78467.1 hypothetical protein ABY58_08490 [Edwardsiella ictaluri]KOO55187.1 hypothetical protein ACS33_09060 [Edwardsiella ictaluri]STP81814.1 Uncharacterised protein [Edwardsiella ictaluri]